MIPRVTNICLSFRCDKRLNLIKLYRLKNLTSVFEYNPNKFSGLIVRLKKSKSTALVFSSGYVSISGLKNFKHIIKSTFECVNIIRANKFENIKQFKVYNICGAIDVNPIDLILLAKTFPICASYEIELFPALKFNFENKIFTVHRSGKIFSTGYKSTEQMNDLFTRFIKFINGGTKEKK
jgi:TATA-box binding protein (TBP) (component of TFIID and TFIIIB)